jgi:hypothetical protein
MALLPWVCTLGGPLLIIPADLAALWRGNDPPLDASAALKMAPRWTAGGVPSDYDRACDTLEDIHVEEYEACGRIPVGEGSALVLDLESSTAGLLWRDGAVLVRGLECETEEDAKAFLDQVAAWRPTKLRLVIGARGLLAFDAAFPGHEDPEKIEADYGVLHLALPPGRYRASCCAIPAERIYLLRFELDSP